MVLYSNWYKLFWHYTPLDTTIYYVTILLLIQQATMPPNSHWYYKLSCYYTIDTWYSNLAYYYTTIDSASLPIVLWYIDTQPSFNSPDKNFPKFLRWKNPPSLHRFYSFFQSPLPFLRIVIMISNFQIKNWPAKPRKPPPAHFPPMPLQVLQEILLPRNNFLIGFAAINTRLRNSIRT